MTDLRNYPEGKGSQVSRYIKDILVDFGVAKTLRQRVTAAQLNAVGGLALTACPALPGVRWRHLYSAFIAIGGNAGGATSVNLSGTVAAATVELVVNAIAGLTRSTVLLCGTANSVVLADGASFTQMDANTALIAKALAAASLTTATAVDFIVDYVADPA
jgi:hypothetical protein